MLRLGTILAVVLGGLVFAWGVPLDRLAPALQAVVTAVSIVSAAVFVRLNRGMPTLDWKGAEPESRKKLTKEIVEVTREYVAIILICLFYVIYVLILLAERGGIAAWGTDWARLASAMFGATSALLICRVVYVVWRDYDIVKLQKVLVDKASDNDSRERDIAVADKKIDDINRAALAVQKRSLPTPWGE